MTRRSNFVALSFLVLASGCAIVSDAKWPEPIPENELDRVFTPQDLARDLADARAFIETVHPAPYQRVAKEQIDVAEKAALAGIDKTLTRREFAPRLERFLAAYGDGHTGGGFPNEDFSKFARTGGRFVPFDAVLDGDAVRAEPVYEAVKDLAAGDRLVAIDGKPIEEWVARLAETSSGPSDWRRAQATTNLRAGLWLEGVVPPVDVVWEKADGRIVERSLQGIIWHARDEGSARANADFDFRVLDGHVGLIDFRRMNGRDEWLEFLEATFRRVKDENLAGVIVDLRANGGGNSVLGSDLLEYLTDRPYKMAARKDWKSSGPCREFLKARVSAWVRWLPLQWFHPIGWKFWGAEEGEIVAFESEEMHPAPANDAPLRFHGPCVFLIGPRTFSSALMLADAVKTSRLATTMGEETAECPTGYGEVIPFRLPRTRLVMQVSTARFVRANGNAEDGSGVEPDVEVKPNAEDIARGIDTALEAARRAILERRLTVPVAPPASLPARGRG